jgi:hypothetical protein
MVWVKPPTSKTFDFFQNMGKTKETPKIEKAPCGG